MRTPRTGPALPNLVAPLLVLLTLATVIACSEGRPPGAPPPQDTSLIVSFSSENAEEQDQAEIVIEIVRVIALSDGGQDVDLGAPDGTIDLVAVDGAPIELVGALVDPGDFTGIEVEFAPEGVVTTPAGLDQDMTLTDTVVTADGEFSVEDGTATEIELLLDLDGRLTFDEESETWELDPRNIDLLS